MESLGFLDRLKSWWEEETDGYVGFRIWQKFKFLKHIILAWKSEDAAKWRKQADTIKDQISPPDVMESSGIWIVEQKTDMANLMQKLDEVLLCEEKDWHQRARIDCVKVGDRNTMFFQDTVRVRRQMNSLSKLMMGTWE